MDVYIYQADIYCEDCAYEIKASLRNDHYNMDDSDQFPQGPYSDGGGEADIPQHCGKCHVFLDNPLTNDGAQYVAEAIRDHYVNKDDAVDVIKEWIEAYRDYEPVAEVLRAVEV